MLKVTLHQNHSFEKIKNCFYGTFNLDGLDKNTGLSISMENCFIRNWENSGTNDEVSGVFLTSEVVLGKDNLTRKIFGMTKFHFGLTNVFRIRTESNSRQPLPTTVTFFLSHTNVILTAIRSPFVF
jgi:hypothetical protein